MPDRQVVLVFPKHMAIAIHSPLHTFNNIRKAFHQQPNTHSHMYPWTDATNGWYIFWFSLHLVVRSAVKTPHQRLAMCNRLLIFFFGLLPQRPHVGLSFDLCIVSIELAKPNKPTKEIEIRAVNILKRQSMLQIPRLCVVFCSLPISL